MKRDYYDIILLTHRATIESDLEINKMFMEITSPEIVGNFLKHV